MKKMLKLTASCLAAFLLVFGFVFSSFAAEAEPEAAAALEEYAGSLISEMASLSDEQLTSSASYYAEYGDTMYPALLGGFMEARSRFGAYVSTGNTIVSQDDEGNYLSKTEVVFENGKGSLNIGISADFSEMTSLTFTEAADEESKSIGSLMKEASVNLVVGMGTVFAVLIFLCWIISLFKYIHKAEEKIKAKKDKPELKPEVIVTKVSEEHPSSDDEIQAVIAAAIAAYESENGSSITKQAALANGKTVRSYRR